ncbi:MAG: hypothetical protein M3O03_13155 [Pseudomonadota bacterium]|nr:hypothetical protein [Pseudomonadota bacterium]
MISATCKTKALHATIATSVEKALAVEALFIALAYQSRPMRAISLLLRHFYGTDHFIYVRNIIDGDDKIDARALAVASLEMQFEHNLGRPRPKTAIVVELDCVFGVLCSTSRRIHHAF